MLFCLLRKRYSYFYCKLKIFQIFEMTNFITKMKQRDKLFELFKKTMIINTEKQYMKLGELQLRKNMPTLCITKNCNISNSFSKN